MTNAVSATSDESRAARLTCLPPPGSRPVTDLNAEERIACDAAFRDCIDHLRTDPATIGRYGPREQTVIAFRAANEVLRTMRGVAEAMRGECVP
jgi:hypothetical protein